MTSSDAAKPWRGRWCWTRRLMPRPWNSYACFRRMVDLPAKPRSAVVRISADARYTLYVNGRRVHQGPARCWPRLQSYDTLDLAPLLQGGRNTICAVVHQYGVPTFQGVWRGAAGFIVDGAAELDGQGVALHTPGEWCCREAAAWRRDAARLSPGLGFQEHYDADGELSGWMSADYAAGAEDGWGAPVDLGPVGVGPWLTMEPRGGPLLADHPEAFRAVVGLFTGENARGYKVAGNVVHLATQERNGVKRERTLLEKPEAMLRDDGETATLHPPEDGYWAMAVLDLGQVMVGHVVLEIAEATGDEIVDILYHQQADKSGAPVLVAGEGGQEIGLGDRYRCRPGAQRWEAFGFKGFRYATLVFRNVDKPLKVAYVGLRRVQAAMPDAGEFQCGDARLTKVWQAARETLRACMLDAYVDCPGPRQAQGWAGARVQFLANTYSFGDVALLERGIRQMAQSQAPDGSLHEHPPCDWPPARSPAAMLAWVGALGDHWQYTGRTDVLKEHLPAMHRVLAYLGRHEARAGLIGGFDPPVQVPDGPPLPEGAISALLNLLYVQALRWADEICRAAGEEGGGYGARAEALAGAVAEHFWDGATRQWRDGFDPATGAVVQQTSQQVTAMAMLLGLRPEASAALAREVLLKSARSRRTKIHTAGPFGYAMVMEALLSAGLRGEVVELIGEKWGGMVDAGATTLWERWDAADAGVNRCHGWSVAPLYLLSQQLLGVVPAEMGWRKVRIAPLSKAVDSARGVVPSPLGPIRVDWEKVGEDQLAVRIDVPAGMTAEFVDPLGNRRLLSEGASEFQT